MENPDRQLKAELTLMYVSDLRGARIRWVLDGGPACMQRLLREFGTAAHNFESLTFLLSKEKEKGTKIFKTEPSCTHQYLIHIFRS